MHLLRASLVAGFVAVQLANVGDMPSQRTAIQENQLDRCRVDLTFLTHTTAFVLAGMHLIKHVKSSRGRLSPAMLSCLCQFLCPWIWFLQERGWISMADDASVPSGPMVSRRPPSGRRAGLQAQTLSWFRLQVLGHLPQELISKRDSVHKAERVQTQLSSKMQVTTNETVLDYNVCM